VQFVLQPRQLARVSESGQRLVHPGTLEISVGGQQPLAGVTGVLSGKLQLTGAAKQVD
jgi:hypothetical protein